MFEKFLLRIWDIRVVMEWISLGDQGFRTDDAATSSSSLLARCLSPSPSPSADRTFEGNFVNRQKYLTTMSFLLNLSTMAAEPSPQTVLHTIAGVQSGLILFSLGGGGGIWSHTF